MQMFIRFTIYDLRFTIYVSSIVNRKSKIVNLDADWPTIAQHSTQTLETSVTPDNLA